MLALKVADLKNAGCIGRVALRRRDDAGFPQLELSHHKGSIVLNRSLPRHGEK